MADSPDKSRNDAQDQSPSSKPQRPRITKADDPPIPQSKALQVFLLLALAITGTAYLVNEWTDFAAPKNHTADSDKLHQLVKSQSAFLEHTTAGQKALQKKQVEKAVSEFHFPAPSRPSKTADALSKSR